MKILHIANFYGPKSGGIKTTIHDLGKRYEKAGHEFTFVVPGINLSKTKTPYGTALYLPSVSWLKTRVCIPIRLAKGPINKSVKRSEHSIRSGFITTMACLISLLLLKIR